MRYFQDAKYIAVSGPIGVGKTTLCDLISSKFNGKIIKEVVEKNPFLEDFYVDKDKYAFQTQIFFLLSRYKQQQELMQQDLFSNFIISDYMFEKDRIFAYMNLNEKEIVLYDTLWKLISANVPKPDLIIYLKASTNVLLERIEKRGREFERNISAEYLDTLNKAYDYFFYHYDDTDLLVIQTDHIDFVENTHHFNAIMDKLNDFKGPKEYYNPVK